MARVRSCFSGRRSISAARSAVTHGLAALRNIVPQQRKE
jgi:hypothetical protein